MLAWTDVRTIIRVQNIRPLYQYLDNKIKENAFRYSQANFENIYSLFHSQKITLDQGHYRGVFLKLFKRSYQKVWRIKIAKSSPSIE